VVAAVWLAEPAVARVPVPLTTPGGRPAIAGGSVEADDDVAAVAAVAAEPEPERQVELGIVAVVCAALTLALGIYPGPLFDVAQDAGAALSGLL
jgi:NADH-quinone oxidoreductase subunit N